MQTPEPNLSLLLALQRQAHAADPAPTEATRRDRLQRLAALLDKHVENFTAQIAQDFGTRAAAEITLTEVVPVRSALRHALGHLRAWMRPRRAATGWMFLPGRSLLLRQPLGVVGIVSPWNYPLLLALSPLVDVLAAGNRALLKPSELTPCFSQGLRLAVAEFFQPEEVVVLTGDATLGQAFCAQPFDHLVFTGSTAVGRLVAQAAAKNLTPVTLELGGKSPNIFMPSIMDKDDDLLSKAIEGFLIYLYDQGEVCASPTRALVHEDIYDAFMARVRDRIAQVGLGHPLEMTTGMGAMTSKTQFDKVMGYLDIGQSEGAKVLHGGGAYTVPGSEGGYYIQPTILEGTNDMRTSREEIFGPVTSIIRFKDEAEALAIANDTEYGLTAGVWSRDYHEIQRFAKGLQAGKIWCNCYYLWPSHTSFGGYKSSGFGREMHKVALNNYRHTKSVVHSFGTQAFGFF